MKLCWYAWCALGLAATDMFIHWRKRRVAQRSHDTFCDTYGIVRGKVAV